MDSKVAFAGLATGLWERRDAIVVNRVDRRPNGSVASVRMMAEGDKNLFGKMGDIMGAMKKAQSFASSAKELQEELRNTELEALSQDGLVKVVISGQQVPIRVEVQDALVAKGAEAVSTSVTEAVKAAHQKSTMNMQEKFGALSNSFGLPTPPAS